MSILVEVWDPTNTTKLGELDDRWDLRWQDALNAPGSASVVVSAGSAEHTLATDRRVLRFVPSWAARPYACQIREVNPRRYGGSGEGLRKDVTLKASDLLTSYMSNACLFPEYGITIRTTGQRYFGYMSLPGPWYVSAEWDAPVGIAQNAWSDKANLTDGGYYPRRWTDGDAEWIWPTDPAAADDAEVVWFRCEFTTASEMAVSLSVAADEYYELWLDGERLATSEVLYGWQDRDERRVLLPAGPHVLAAQCENIAVPPPNVSGFLLSVEELDGFGEPTGTIVIRTNETDWVCKTGSKPGWYAGQIAAQILEEAQDISTRDLAGVTIGWDDDVDSDGVAWVERLEINFPVQESISSVLYTLAQEAGVDFWFDCETNTLHCSQLRGTDLSVTVALEVGSAAGGSVTELDISHRSATATSLLGQHETGWFIEDDAGGLAVHGRITRGATFGGSSSEGPARDAAQRQLAFDAYVSSYVVVEHIMEDGPVPMDDYDLGDYIAVPADVDGSTQFKARALGFTFTENARTGRVQVRPEFTVAELLA